MEYIMSRENKDSFVSRSEESKLSASIFIVIGCMIVATIMSLLLFWTYRLDPRLCYGILWSIVFVYAAGNLIYTAVAAKSMTSRTFRVFLAIHSIMTCISAPLLIYYFIYGSYAVSARKAALSRSSSSYGNSTYEAPVRPMPTIADLRAIEANPDSPDSHSF